MNPFEMIVIIVLICVGAGVVNHYFRMKANRQADAASDADMDRVLGEVNRLKERVRVLEKIATDQERQLSEEIRKLA